jgi:hypothetical protein
MKKATLHRFLLPAFLVLIGTMQVNAQNQVAVSSFKYLNANNFIYHGAGVRFKSSEGTVCDNNSPQCKNYYIYTGHAQNPGGVSWNDEANITLNSDQTPTQNRFKAIAGKPVTLTLDFSLAYGNNAGPDAGYYINTLNGNVEARIGTRHRSNTNGSNPYYDTTLIFIKKNEPVFDGWGYNHTYTCTFKFRRGSQEGHIVVTIPVKNYDGQTRYEEFIIPYLVSGPLDSQVKYLGITTEPQIPYMVLHRPPGDLSSATISKTENSCRHLEETYSSNEANNVFGSVKLGVKGSIGFVATIDYEIYAEISAGVTIGNLKIENSAKESCITTSSTISTTNINPAANASDLFIGYGTDLYYAVAESLSFKNCSYTVDTGLVYVPVDGTYREFKYTAAEIESEIAEQQDSLSKIVMNGPGDALRVRRDSARLVYQVNVWKQVLALNEANKLNAIATGSVDKEINSTAAESYTATTSITQTKAITVEHYIDAEAGLQGVVNIGGSGFSLGYKFTTSKNFGNTISDATTHEQSISYSLGDDDPGDRLFVKIKRDPMYGTAVFDLLSGSKSSCPYEGGIQRDQPRLEFLNTESNQLIIPNATVGTTESFYLKVVNDAAERRAYRLRLGGANSNNAIIKAGGNSGPEFTGANGISLNAHDSTTYRVDIAQNTPDNLSFPDIQFELIPLCDDGISSSVSATVNYGNMVRSITNGSWNNKFTWDAKRIPQPTDNVLINPNTKVTIPDNVDLKCRNLTLGTGSNLTIPITSKLTTSQ